MAWRAADCWLQSLVVLGVAFLSVLLFDWLRALLWWLIFSTLKLGLWVLLVILIGLFCIQGYLLYLPSLQVVSAWCPLSGLNSHATTPHRAAKQKCANCT